MVRRKIFRKAQGNNPIAELLYFATILILSENLFEKQCENVSLKNSFHE